MSRVEKARQAFRSFHRLNNVGVEIDDHFNVKEIIMRKPNAQQRRRMKMWSNLAERLCHKMSVEELELL